MRGSSGCLGTVAQVLAGLLAGAFILSLPIALLARSASVVVFSPRALTEIVASRLLESPALRRSLVQGVFQGMMEQTGTNQGATDESLSHLGDRQFDEIAAIVLPSGWAKQQIVANLDRLYAWIDNSQQRPSIVLEIQPIKDRLQGGGAAELADLIVDSWPTCTQDQISQIMSAAILGGASSLVCEPPEPFRGLVVAMIEQGLTQTVGALPSLVQLDEGGAAAQQDAEIGTLKEQIRMVRFLAKWGWLLPVSFLGLIVALVVRSASGMCRWWGIPMLGGGVISLVLCLSLPALAFRALVASLPDGAMNPVANEVVRALAGGVLQSIRTRALSSAGLVTGLGILLLLIGWWINRRTARSAVAYSPAVQGEARPPATSEDTQTHRPESSPAEVDGKRPSGMFG